MKYLTIIIVIICISSLNGLNFFHKNICLRTADEDCNHRLSYACGWKYCTSGKKECNEFLELSQHIRSIKRPLTYESKLKKFKAFINSLQECNF